MRRLLILLACMFVPQFVCAQTPHPCDVPPEVNPSLTGQVHKAGFCHAKKDADGNDTTITSASIYLDTNLTPSWTGPLVQVTPTPNAGGFYYFETASITWPKGAHVTNVTVSGPGGVSPKPAVPFAFSIVDGIPSMPTGLRLVR